MGLGRDERPAVRIFGFVLRNGYFDRFSQNDPASLLG